MYPSPVIVAPDANIQTAASRVMWAKCFNGGQVSLMLIFVLQTTSLYAHNVVFLPIDLCRSRLRLDFQASNE